MVQKQSTGLLHRLCGPPSIPQNPLFQYSIIPTFQLKKPFTSWTITKKERPAQGIKPVMVQKQSTGFAEYSIQKKIFQANFQAEQGNVKSDWIRLKKSNSSEPEFFTKEGLKLSLLCKGGLKPPAHRVYGSLRDFFNIAQTTDNLFQFLTTILN